MATRSLFLLLACALCVLLAMALPHAAADAAEGDALQSEGEWNLEQIEADLALLESEMDSAAEAEGFEEELAAESEGESQAEATQPAAADYSNAGFMVMTPGHGQRCNNNKGTCMFKSTCTGSRVISTGHCLGTSYCCMDTAGSPAFPFGSDGLCGFEYARGAIQRKPNNAKVNVAVTPIIKAHLTNPAIFGLDDTKADNLLLASTACAYNILFSEAKRAGHAPTINSGFRSFGRQQYFWDCYQCRVRQGGVRTGCCNNGNTAARPGTSNHGTGIALDLQLSAAAYEWMRKNAEGLGWVRTVSDERWHWEYRPGTKQTDFFPL